MTSFATGGTALRVEGCNPWRLIDRQGAVTPQPITVTPITAVESASAADYECGFCERGQCARCSDKACTCCNGNPDGRPV